MDMNSLDFSQGDDSVQQFAVSPGGYLGVGKAPLRVGGWEKNNSSETSPQLSIRIIETNNL